MIEPDRALPGRETAMPVPASHDVLGTPLQPPFPEGSRRSWSAWAASGAPSACSGSCPACTRRRSATPAATRRTRPTRRSAAGRPATPRPCWWSSTRPRSRATRSCAPSGRATTRPRACARATTWAPQYRSAVYYDSDEQKAAVEASRDRYQASLTAAGRGEITTEIAAAGPFYYAEDYHQQYLDKNPSGYCGLGGTGVSCPVGLGATAE